MNTHQNQSTALVVDDGKVDQRLAGRLLKDQLGLAVEYADDGYQALSVIEDRPPDIVITDMKMPGMDGLELIEEIRREYATLPVIVMMSLPWMRTWPVPILIGSG